VNGSGREGENQENLAVYGREGTPCKTCGTLIKYVKQGGRGTHYCPHCQH
ncbi:MAG: DNA-formamidopyrimidine glycosylase, partial [Megasphaera micronuciformis]|nr:DNA-formamidopyrimidine glycosylase [Megasphaera micronuciformis]